MMNQILGLILTLYTEPTRKFSNFELFTLYADKIRVLIESNLLESGKLETYLYALIFAKLKLDYDNTDYGIQQGIEKLSYHAKELNIEFVQFLHIKDLIERLQSSSIFLDSHEFKIFYDVCEFTPFVKNYHYFLDKLQAEFEAHTDNDWHVYRMKYLKKILKQKKIFKSKEAFSENEQKELIKNFKLELQKIDLVKKLGANDAI